jgi:hypothetical protein
MNTQPVHEKIKSIGNILATIDLIDHKRKSSNTIEDQVLKKERKQCVSQFVRICEEMITCSETTIASLWDVEDVIEKADQMGIQITKEDAFEVLERINYNHDANIGINWDVIGMNITDIKSDS